MSHPEEETSSTDASADLRTVSWGDSDAENTALLLHSLTGRADAFRALVEVEDTITRYPR